MSKSEKQEVLCVELVTPPQMIDGLAKPHEYVTYAIHIHPIIIDRRFPLYRTLENGLPLYFLTLQL